jgi:hypothetical protein
LFQWFVGSFMDEFQFLFRSNDINEVSLRNCN